MRVRRRLAPVRQIDLLRRIRGDERRANRTAEKDDDSVPFVGWVGFLPADAESGAGWQYARRVTVPYAAWPLVQLLLRLESRLRELPTHPDRPIIGAATDPRECKRRLAGFILQPLLAAHALGAKDVLQADPPLPGQSPLEGSAREEWLETLRHLGLFWDRALAGMVAGAILNSLRLT